LSWRITESRSEWTFLRTRMRASTFSRSWPSISRSSSTDNDPRLKEDAPPDGVIKGGRDGGKKLGGIPGVRERK